MNNQNLILTKKRARIESVEHPDGHLKCQVRLVGLWDNIPKESLPWAEYELPVGARFNDGDFSPCQVGDYVWVRFDEGDTRFPIITGSCYFAPDKVPNLPHEVFGGEKAHEHKRMDGQPLPSAPSKEDRVSIQHNLMIELTHEGAYRVTHKPTGTAWEITKDGEIVFHTEADRYDSVKGKFKGEVIGLFEQTADDNYVLKVAKDKKVDIGGGLNFVVKGSANFDVKGTFTVDSASKVSFLEGMGVVTGASACHYTGSPHGDCSTKVFAAK